MLQKKKTAPDWVHSEVKVQSAATPSSVITLDDDMMTDR
jgi:hypothetical protein